MTRNILKFLILIVGTLFFSSAVFAYELDGTMTLRPDGSYSVVLKNSYGHVFVGTATDEGDGELEVSVADSEGNSFSGYALDNSNGGYILDLQNDDTGDNATGTIEEK